MRITMKMYEEYLNACGVPEDEKYENGGKCRGKKYGSWLRRTDKVAFDAGYNEYAKKLESGECDKIKEITINKPVVSKIVDPCESVVLKEITDILKQENIENECHIITSKEFKSEEYDGNPPLLMIRSELESTFIAEFIEECLPKNKYFLKPCSDYLLGVYPKKEISTTQECKLESRLMVG